MSLTTIPRLNDAIDRRRSTARDVAAVVATDAGLSARVLALSNSAQYGLCRQVQDLDQAVALVGTQVVRTIAVAGACSMLDRRCGLPDARHHAFEVAVAAGEVARRLGLPTGDGFAAGLLHDVGELLLWQEHPTEYATVRAGWFDASVQLEAERDLYGIDHAELGAEHLFEWRVPCSVVDAVGDHHDPRPESSALTLVVAAADEIVSGSPVAGSTAALLGLDALVVDAVRVAAVDQAAALAAALVPT